MSVILMMKSNRAYKNINIQLRSALLLGLIIVFIIALSAIAWRSMSPYITGPSIASYEYDLSGDIYNIRGTSTRAKILKIQGRQVPIDINGAFSTDIAKLDPYTILIIEASDRFGHSLLIRKEL